MFLVSLRSTFHIVKLFISQHQQTKTEIDFIMEFFLIYKRKVFQQTLNIFGPDTRHLFNQAQDNFALS